MKFFLIVDGVTENWRLGFEFLNSRAGKHRFIDAEKIWFYDAPNERIIDEEIIFFSKVRIVGEEKTDGNFRMMALNPVNNAWVETLEINFRVTITFEIFFERSEYGFTVEGNVGMLGGF